MPNASTAEIYFIAAMMILMLLFSVVSIYIFFRTYKKEMREKEKRNELKNQSKKEGEIEIEAGKH